MPNDGYTLHKVIFELRDILVGGKVNKVVQPEKDEIILHFYNEKSTYKLLLSCNCEQPRIHLTQFSLENPLSPPVFCMTLRKHLQGCVLTNIVQEKMDRTIRLDFLGLNELHDEEQKFLYIEIMGRHSNIVLVSEKGKIIAANKSSSLDTENNRKILAGLLYEPFLCIDKIFILDSEQLKARLCESGNLSTLLQKTVCGISKICADEIAYHSPNDIEGRIQALKDFYNRKIEAVITDKDFLTYKYNTIQSNFIPYPTINEAIDNFYYQKDKRQRFLEKAKHLLKLLKNQISRQEKKLAKAQNLILSSKDFDRYKIMGELLTSNLYKLNCGISNITLQNYYSESYEEITIELDKNLSPSKNAQRYYKKYSKEKRTYELNLASIDEIEQSISYHKSIEQSFAICSEISELAQIQEELISLGLLKPLDKKQKNQQQKKSLPFSFAVEGYTVLAGKNNLQNDELTKSSRQNDLWLHVLKEHGSHVIIQNPSENEIPGSVIEFAAKKAKEYSSAKDGGKIAVDYTYKKYVKKPPKAKPGMVTYTNQKTIIV